MLNRPHYHPRPYGLPTRQDAQVACDALNARLEAGETHPLHLDVSRDVVRYEPQGHSFHPQHRMGNETTIETWGVWPVWGYSDRPDLGKSFGGPFVHLDEVSRHMERRAR